MELKVARVRAPERPVLRVHPVLPFPIQYGTGRTLLHTFPNHAHPLSEEVGRLHAGLHALFGDGLLVVLPTTTVL